MPAVGKSGWAVLTSDHRIRYREAERSAATAAGVASFIFTGKKTRAAAIANALVVALPRMLRLLESEPRPFIAKVSRSGTVALVR